MLITKRREPVQIPVSNERYLNIFIDEWRARREQMQAEARKYPNGPSKKALPAVDSFIVELEQELQQLGPKRTEHARYRWRCARTRSGLCYVNGTEGFVYEINPNFFDRSLPPTELQAIMLQFEHSPIDHKMTHETEQGRREHEAVQKVVAELYRKGDWVELYKLLKGAVK
jgi:hypothetical protein